jgi:hypothetical protein
LLQAAAEPLSQAGAEAAAAGAGVARGGEARVGCAGEDLVSVAAGLRASAWVAGAWGSLATGREACCAWALAWGAVEGAWLWEAAGQAAHSLAALPTQSAPGRRSWRTGQS